MLKFTHALAVVIIAAGLLLESCTKSEGPNTLKVVKVTTDSGTALDGSSMATDIPVNSSIVVSFDKEIKTSTATSTAVLLKADGANVPTTVSATGTTLTVKPGVSLPTGTVVTLSVGTELQANDGAFASATDFNFKTFGKATTAPPQSTNQLSYFAFSGTLGDAAGNHTPTAADVRDITFVSDRFGFAGMAADFNGSTSIVEIPNGEQYMANNSLTVSVWIKANSGKAGHFVLGLAGWKGFYFTIAADWSSVSFPTQYALGNGLSDYEDNLFLGTGETNQNTGWQGWTFQKDVLPHGGGVGTTYFKDKWAHVICTYDASSKLATMYINGEKVKQHDFNLWPAGDPKKGVTGVKFAGNLTGGGNKLALGFIQGSQNRTIAESWADPGDIYSNHFKGQMDDLRIFKVALTATEVSTLYAAEKPSN